MSPVIPSTTMAHAMVTLTILEVAGFVNGSGMSSSGSPELLVEVPMRLVMVVLAKRSV
jgi:hypothetical protein